MAKHLDVGRQGEDLSVVFLKKKGFKLVQRNARTPFGEIDIICLDGVTVVFIEVKTRSSLTFGPGDEAVDRSKRRRLSRAAESFLIGKKWTERPARFDILTVDLSGPLPRLDHLVDAFDPVMK